MSDVTLSEGLSGSAAEWYSDPYASSPVSVRWFDGDFWTQYTHCPGEKRRSSASGWYMDPLAGYRLRHFDGVVWTNWTCPAPVSLQRVGQGVLMSELGHAKAFSDSSTMTVHRSTSGSRGVQLLQFPAPGWYVDLDVSGQLRWFDGSVWTVWTVPAPLPIPYADERFRSGFYWWSLLPVDGPSALVILCVLGLISTVGIIKLLLLL